MRSFISNEAWTNLNPDLGSLLLLLFTSNNCSAYFSLLHFLSFFLSFFSNLFFLFYLSLVRLLITLLPFPLPPFSFLHPLPSLILTWVSTALPLPLSFSLLPPLLLLHSTVLPLPLSNTGKDSVRKSLCTNRSLFAHLRIAACHLHLCKSFALSARCNCLHFVSTPLPVSLSLSFYLFRRLSLS